MNQNPITALVAVPYGRSRRHRMFAFGDRVARVKSKTESTEVFLYGPDGIGQVSGVDMNPIDGERWATTVFEGRIYFTNLSTPIHCVTEAPYVLRMGNQPVLTPTSLEIPCAKYIDTFFDHLVIANVNYEGDHPYRVQWSNLRNFGDWKPRKASEADYYDILEGQSGLVAGVTGLGKMNNLMVAYTASSIWVSPYVGLPLVFRWEDIVKDIGSDFPYSLVVTASQHFFISEQWQNIGVFDGQSMPKPIGDSIAPFFFSDLTSDSEYRYRVWGYVDRKNRELVWVYVSKDSSGEFDREIVYSLKDFTWYVRDCENLHSFCNGGTCGKTIHDLGLGIDELTGPMNKLGAGDEFPHFWGTGDGELLEETTGESAYVQEVPYLETHDMIYGDIQAVKELESMCIQANLGTALELTVYVSSRQNLSDPVVYQELPQPWKPDLKEGRLSLPRLSGRIIRFKFQPFGEQVDNFKWYTFVENVYGAKQVEK